MTDISIQFAPWEQYRDQLREIRYKVFVEEQSVPVELEWDDKDQTAEHFLAYQDEKAFACARLIDHKKIGRMAVLPEYRGSGAGMAILEFIKNYAKEQEIPELSLSAQCQAFQFYSNAGYIACSTPYDDADIPHIDMTLGLTPKGTKSVKKYGFGEDGEIHHGKSSLEATGYLDIMLSQSQRALILCIRDLNHPLSAYEGLLDRIKKLARHKRFFNTYLLIGNYHTQYNEHPLIQLKNRLPSFIEMRVTHEAIPNQWLFDGVGWLDFDGNESRACYSDRPRIKQFMERFNLWWKQAKETPESRPLSI